MRKGVAPLALVTAAAVAGLCACSTLPGQASTVTYGKPIKIGVPLAFTGDLKAEGAMEKQGYQLWENWVNGPGGGVTVAGVRHRVEIVYGDDQSQPADDARLAEEMVTRDKVQFLLGPYGGSNTAAVSLVAKEHHMPLVSANGSSPSVFTNGAGWAFGVETPAAENMNAIFDMAANLHPQPTTVAILSASDSFSAEVAKGAAAYAAARGFRVVMDQSYPSGSTDLYGLLAQAQALHPDILLNSGHLVEAVAITEEAKQLRFDPELFTYSVGPSMPAFVGALKADANYTATASQWTPEVQYRPSYYLTVPEYVAAYQRTFHTSLQPNYQVADATAAGLALEVAIEHARSLAPNRVRRALANLDLMTFYGRIKFDATGQDTYKPMLVEQIQGGQRQTVWPQQFAATTALFPTPTWAARDRISPQPQDPKSGLPPTGEPPAAP